MVFKQLEVRYFLFFLISLFGCIDLQGQEGLDVGLLEENTFDDPENYYELSAESIDFLSSNEGQTSYLPFINSCDSTSLALLYSLNPLQINAYLAYIREFGFLLSYYELAYIEYFDYLLIQKIIQIDKNHSKETHIYGPDPEKKVRQDILFRWAARLECPEAYIQGVDSSIQYPGSRSAILLKYSYSDSRNVRLGIVAEKDAGEAFFSGPQKYGFDLYSAALQLKFKKIFRKIIIGDYHLEYGQGLSLWTGPNFSSTSDASAIKRKSREIRPNTSASEGRFLRGLAWKMDFGKFQISPFFSSLKRDVSPVSFLDDKLEAFSAIRENGYHRTSSELLGRKALKESLFGVIAGFSLPTFSLNINAYKLSFDALFVKDQRKAAYFFDFQGDQCFHTGFEICKYFNNTVFFVDMASSDLRPPGFCCGLKHEFQPDIVYSIVFRYYPPEFYSLLANVAYAGRNFQQYGVFSGFNMTLGPSARLSLSSDIYRNTWMPYNKTHFPVSYKGQCKIHASSGKSELRFQFFLKVNTNEILTENRQIKDVNSGEQLGLNLRFRSLLDDKTLLTSGLCLRCSFFDDEDKSTSKLIYQDVKRSFIRDLISIYFRLALYNTDSYSERIYLYENDVLWAFSVPAFYYRGMRTAVLVSWKLNRHISLWLKFGCNYFFQRKSLGTGPDMTSGSYKSDLKFQLRLKI